MGLFRIKMITLLRKPVVARPSRAIPSDLCFVGCHGQYSSASINPKMYSTVLFARYSCNLGWQSRPTKFALDFYQTVDAAAWQKTQQMWLGSWVARHQNNL